jgi:protease IV
MRFAGRVWRLLVGIKDGLVLVFMLVFFGALFAVLTARPSPADVRGGALVLELDGFVVEERQRVDPIESFLTGQAPIGEYQARDLVRAIDAAATDSRIKAVVLDLDRFMGGGQVHLAAVGAALDRVRAAKKPVLAYATAYANDGLLLAAHASEVWMDPIGGTLVAGPGGNQLYYKGLLDRLRVDAKVYRVGTYKSAVEPFIAESMSPEARENYQSLYGALWSEWQASVAKARPKANIALAANNPIGWLQAGGGDLAQAALRAGLVDKLGSRAAFDARLVGLVGADAWSDKLNGYTHTGLGPWLEQLGPPAGGAPIGVVTVAGDIVDGDAGPGTAGGRRIADLLDEAMAQDFKALVVRIDSPGGSVLASEEIRRAILRHKTRRIPVAVSMANLAASGGYWIATAGDRIFAEPDTVTGSIGIFAVVPTFQRAAADIGINADGVRTTPLSGQPDFIGGFTPELDQVIQAQIEDGYSDFVTRVAQARKMTPAAVDRIAQGRVWDGGAARQVGLVDQYGGLEDALAWAAAKAGLKEGGYHAVYLGSEEDTYDTLLRRWLVDDGQAGDRAARRDVTGLMTARQQAFGARLARDLDRLLGGSGMQAYCLECPTVPRASTAQGVGEASGLLATLGALLLKLG